MQTESITLPLGVKKIPLRMHRDDRGIFTELFRQEWETGVRPIQWNFVRSKTNVLRGVHVHPRHNDYLIILDGKASIGLQDLRPNSPTKDVATVVEVSGDHLVALMIPHGVAHGFYYHTPAFHLYSVSHYWDVADELRIHWTDIGLHIPWSFTNPHLSRRDAEAGPLSDAVALLAPWQPTE